MVHEAVVHTANILLVDDDHELRTFMGEILSAKGYAVSEAFDYDSAVGQLTRGAFDLALLDITLPGRSGLEILEYIRGRNHGVPVIVVTGTAGLDLAIRSMALGAKDYITKPCTPNYLLQSVENALAPQHP